CSTSTTVSPSPRSQRTSCISFQMHTRSRSCPTGSATVSSADQSMAETRVAFDDGDAYDRYMGRWSRAIAENFLAWLDPPSHRRWLDVGCGTGAFTDVILGQAAPEKIIAIDPSPQQIEH